MARFFGKVGFSFGSTETSPGVWTNNIVERTYYGDVMKRSRRWESGDNINDDLKINNQISILADQFAEENLYAVKYIEWMGTKWKVTSVEIEHPRMVLTMGDIYTEVS